jgi:tetratricopeptide (TPR) repeat protein
MANSALIDDLLKQFADNPRRVFARLANEYRKRGELDSAIEICRSHVPLQPGYISGHIVLGQALYDSGSLEEARTTFETALALDPENLIALRHMGDIARTNGEIEGARSWYRQLLEIDPQNEDVAAQVESLGGAAEQREAVADAGPEAAPDEMAGWGDVSPDAIDLTLEDPAEEPAEASAEEEAPQAAAVVEVGAPASELADDESPYDQSAEDQSADDESADDALALEQIFDLPEKYAVDAGSEEELPPVAPVEGLESTAFESEADEETSAPEPVAVAELPSDAVEASESSEQSEETPPEPIAIAPLFSVEGASEVGSDDSEEDDAGPSAFATETMAELYLQQGFPDRAMTIYRELAARDPENVSLQERIAELTAGGEETPQPAPAAKSSRTAREFFGVLAYRRAPQAAFQEPVLEESAPQDPAPAPREEQGGRPGREAASALSLDDVFRDAAAPDGVGSRKGLSFDEFFARRGNGTAEANNGSVATENGEAPAAAEHSADGEPQDLELFHAWLDGLKG